MLFNVNVLNKIKMYLRLGRAIQQSIEDASEGEHGEERGVQVARVVVSLDTPVLPRQLAQRVQRGDHPGDYGTIWL